MQFVSTELGSDEKWYEIDQIFGERNSSMAGRELLRTGIDPGNGKLVNRALGPPKQVCLTLIGGAYSSELGFHPAKFC